MAGFLGRMMGNQMAKMMPGMSKMQEALQKISVSGSAEGGLVKVTIGKAADMSSTITSIKIDEKIIQAGPQRVENAVKTAVNEALAKEMEQLKGVMMEVAKDMKLP
eukprot:TRINITY_DN9421_c0_g1_i1.p1 TRINITY_DN9421_c0_g1~~TRINITY_DN9421_c0_g1_i1.p1  ORF type:complete len:106 (-),score=28.42 TRINITY_DN9421_c0_g1_i1:50-367(-)